MAQPRAPSCSSCTSSRSAGRDTPATPISSLQPRFSSWPSSPSTTRARSPMPPWSPPSRSLPPHSALPRGGGQSYHCFRGQRAFLPHPPTGFTDLLNVGLAATAAERREVPGAVLAAEGSVHSRANRSGDCCFAWVSDGRAGKSACS